jgi:hypothetical protein
LGATRLGNGAVGVFKDGASVWAITVALASQNFKKSLSAEINAFSFLSRLLRKAKGSKIGKSKFNNPHKKLSDPRSKLGSIGSRGRENPGIGNGIGGIIGNGGIGILIGGKDRAGIPGNGGRKHKDGKGGMPPKRGMGGS